MSHLTLVHARHDLPPSWDGVPVEWSEWSEGHTTLALHVPADKLACDRCGAIEEASISFGKRPPEHPTFMTTRTKTTKSGHQYDVPHEVEAWAVRDLIAARCRHCLHDVVTDTRTGEAWDLEAPDYEDAGSYPDDVLF
ncbi:hypothetical protein [Arthrobacter sp. SAFR-014]|uniref:hypothetical protein n=1 Tax=unclassified Arthrobacter TaxID=235627 RepID=UPI003F7B8556